MLTLFHHSLPPWAGEYGGWKLEKTVDYFMDFTRFLDLVNLKVFWTLEDHILYAFYCSSGFYSIVLYHACFHLLLVKT